MNVANNVQRKFKHDLVYWTEIGMGTPPQLFPVLVGISSPGTFVMSINCHHCAPGDVRCDSSKSSTFHENSAANGIWLWWVFTSGNMSQDTFHFDRLTMENQIFQKATDVEPIGLTWDNLNNIHGLLGLTPSSAGSKVNNPSIFMRMVLQRVQDHHVFSLRPPEPREIVFGNANQDHFNGELTSSPLINKISANI